MLIVASAFIVLPGLRATGLHGSAHGRAGVSYRQWKYEYAGIIMYEHTDILLEKGGGEMVSSLHTPQLALDVRVEARKSATYIPTAQTSLTIITQLWQLNYSVFNCHVNHSTVYEILNTA